jgi:PIN domain nuclease of toxin-antitoxin system
VAETQPGLALDAGAVIALFRSEPAASRVRELLRERTARMSVVNAAETVDVLVRRHEKASDDVLNAVDELVASGVELVPASLDVATRAGELRARLFDRRSRRLSLADCFLLATVEGGDSVVTTDETLAAAARDAGIDVVVLPT